jgi:SAM-dependent methyltransferase
MSRTSGRRADRFVRSDTPRPTFSIQFGPRIAELSIVEPNRDPGQVERFYDDRYGAGYMEEWPAWKKRRIRDVVRALDLPRAGRALDFGCGQGVFTQVVKDALPGWEVHGCDISQVAIDLAAQRFPRCRFFAAGDPARRPDRFDLVLSHHVLEHVADLGRTFAEMADHAGASARMLHVLPCGNPGSLEHRIASVRPGGIDPARGNRFWFEDEGHLRRLTTAEMEAQLARLGFRLIDARYANQFHGTLDWVTTCGAEFVADFADPTRVADADDEAELARLRARLDRLARLRTAAPLRRPRSVREAVRTVLGLGRQPIARAVDRYCLLRSDLEWRMRSRQAGGSEMYLVFARAA